MEIRLWSRGGVDDNHRQGHPARARTRARMREMSELRQQGETISVAGVERSRNHYAGRGLGWVGRKVGKRSLSVERQDGKVGQRHLSFSLSQRARAGSWCPHFSAAHCVRSIVSWRHNCE